MKQCDKPSSRFACSLFRYSWIPGHGFSSDSPYGSGRDSDSSRGSRQSIRPEGSTIHPTAPPRLPALPAPSRLATRHVPILALPGGFDSGMTPGVFPARLRDSRPNAPRSILGDDAGIPVLSHDAGPYRATWTPVAGFRHGTEREPSGSREDAPGGFRLNPGGCARKRHVRSWATMPGIRYDHLPGPYRATWTPVAGSGRMRQCADPARDRDGDPARDQADRDGDPGPSRIRPRVRADANGSRQIPVKPVIHGG